MEAPNAESVAPPEPQRRRVRLSRVAASWAFLLLAASLVRVLACVGGWIDPRWLADSTLLGPGMMAVAGGALGLVGLASAWLNRAQSGIALGLALLALVAAHGVCVVLFPPRFVLERLQSDEALFFAEPTRPLFALTIDDGLDPEMTPVLLDVLARHDAGATFFVFGETLAEHPQLARRCLAEGHELANHQMTDTPAVELEDDALEAAMVSADGLLRELTTPRWFRPGGGVATERSHTVAKRLGYETALGSVFPFDSHIGSSRFIAAYVAGRTGPGDIVVLHDRGERGERAAAALDAALASLAERGLKAVTLTELIQPD